LNCIPLSHEQLDIWKCQRDERRRCAFNIPVLVRFFGRVDKDAITDAVRDVIDRHEILRTIYPESDGLLRQEILESAAAPVLSLQQVDTWSMAKIVNAATDYTFDLGREVPVRIHLFSTGQSEHTLFFVFHRIAFDSHSVDPLMRDLSAFYSARVENRKPDLPPLPMQYADYARIQYIDANNMAVMDVATDGEDEDFVSKGIVSLRINPGMHGRLIAFAKEAGVTVDSILHTGLAILFSRLDLGDRAAISVIKYADLRSANTERRRFVTENDLKCRISTLIGNFETILSFEIDIQGNQTFREAVNCSAKTVRVDSAHQSCNFRTLFRLKPVGIETFDFPMLKVFVNTVQTTELGFDLIFDLSERLSPDGKPQGIEGSVIFNNVFVFPARHMPIRLDWMMTLLKHGVISPDTRIDELPIEEKPTTWTCAALAPECPATEPEYITITRVATVYDNGRNERVSLSSASVSSAVTTAPGWQQSYVAFQDVLQCRLAGIWEETLDVSRVGVRDRFADLGGDEVKARRIVSAINKVFMKNFPVSLMCGGVTVESLANAIFHEMPLEPVSVIQPILPVSKLPLFFVHGVVFGGGLYTIELSKYLGMDRPFFSFNPHGMNGLDIPETIEKMAEDNLKILRQMYPDGRFWLGGFCNGALVAHEMARIMEREGQRIESPLLLVEAPHGDISEEVSKSTTEQKSRTAKPSKAPNGLQMRKTWVLNELFKLSDSYRPGKYAGPVAVIQPKKSLSNEALVQSVWKKAADNIQFLNTPGDHITCIGRYAPELAGILCEVMDGAVHFNQIG